MSTYVVETGNHVVGYAVRAARVQVIAAYPITPQTPIVEQLATMTETGKLKAKYIRVESEHSALAACIGAAFVGARTFTATSSQGLAYMHEMLHWTSGSRLPVIMAVVNRALGPPWNIWTDHTDSLSQRDTGWIQLYCASNQEIFDALIQCYCICESHEVSLPAMICLEGVTLSHTLMPAVIPDQEEVDAFLSPYKPLWFLNTQEPRSVANVFSPAEYMKLREDTRKAMNNARIQLCSVAKDYSHHFGLPFHGDMIEYYRCEDAESVMFALGALASEAKTAVDELRGQGHRIGLARIRVFRPFPIEEVRKLAEPMRSLIVFDRDFSMGMEGILSTELKATLFALSEKPTVTGFVVGLGGVDVTSDQIARLVEKVLHGDTRVDSIWFGG